MTCAITDEILATVNAALTAEYHKSSPNYAGANEISREIELNEGRTWRRLEIVEYSKDRVQLTRSAYGFLKVGTNLLFKAAGWAAPAKNHPRCTVEDWVGKCATVYKYGIK